MSLSSVLSEADVADLDVLTDYITDNGAGRLALDGEVCRRLLHCKRQGSYSESDRDLIEKEIRAFGGNSLVNLFRGGGIKYGELVKDVATHLKINFPKGAVAPDVELEILKKLFSDSVAKMTAEERQRVLDSLNVGELSGLGAAQMATALTAARLGGFATYKMAMIVANGIAKALLDRGLTLATNAAINRIIGIAIGPVGWVVTGLWTMADFASPAYRVTVPCVVQVAYMRLKARAKREFISCPSCQEQNPSKGKFCHSCGTNLHDKPESVASHKRPAAKKATPKKIATKKAQVRKTAVRKEALGKASTGKKATTKKAAATETVVKKTLAKSKTPKIPPKKALPARRVAAKSR